MLKDRQLMRYSVFILFTATLLYIIYLVLTNLFPILAALGAGLGSVASALSPLIIGLVIAYLMNPLTGGIERLVSRRIFRLPEDPARHAGHRRRTRILSVLLAYGLVVVLIILFLYFLATLLIGRIAFNISLTEIYQAVSTALVSYSESVREWVANLPGGMFTEQIDKLTQSFFKWFAENLSPEAAVSFIGGIGISLVNFFIGLIISIYLSIDKDFFLSMWHRTVGLVLPARQKTWADRLMSEINGVVGKFTRGVLLDALIVGILSSIALMIAGLDFAVFVGIFAGICNVIPYFGPIIGMIPAFFIGLFTDGLWQGVLAVIILLVIQQVDSNLIYPRVVGSSTGLHPLFVLLAVSIGGYYSGLLGMVVAVPVAGILQILILRFAAWREAGRRDKGEPGPEAS
jgi:predicted PurR-regulated permease PerM